MTNTFHFISEAQPMLEALGYVCRPHESLEDAITVETDKESHVFYRHMYEHDLLSYETDDDEDDEDED